MHERAPCRFSYVSQVTRRCRRSLFQVSGYGNAHADHVSVRSGRLHPHGTAIGHLGAKRAQRMPGLKIHNQGPSDQGARRSRPAAVTVETLTYRDTPAGLVAQSRRRPMGNHNRDDTQKRAPVPLGVLYRYV